MIKSYKDLDVYNLSYKVAMDIFQLSKKFPKEELYSLTSQIIRSSRSISANIVEGWSKRHYENKFKVHLIDALGQLEKRKTGFVLPEIVNIYLMRNFQYTMINWITSEKC